MLPLPPLKGTLPPTPPLILPLGMSLLLPHRLPPLLDNFSLGV